MFLPVGARLFKARLVPGKRVDKQNRNNTSKKTTHGHMIFDFKQKKLTAFMFLMFWTTLTATISRRGVQAASTYWCTIYIYIYIHSYVYVCICMCVCIHIYIYTCTYRCTHIYIYILCVYIYIYIYTYIHTYVRTHIHTHYMLCINSKPRAASRWLLLITMLSTNSNK